MQTLIIPVGLIVYALFIPTLITSQALPVKRPGIRACHAPETWVTENMEFRILHPSTGLPYLGNDSSCVISVNGPGLSLLLSGDISRAVEQRLVSDGLEQHAILTAPHHGSSTSSSQSLIDAVMPSWVLISAAHGNRFDFPRADVLERYANSNVAALETARCGGIRMTSDGLGGVRISSARIASQGHLAMARHRELPISLRPW